VAERSWTEEDECCEVRGRIASSRELNGVYSFIYAAASFRLSVDMLLVDAH
jgi:hypothetical protein